MKRLLTIAIVSVLAYTGYAQTGKVGVNETAPKATLDVKSNTANTTGDVEGILIPRVNKEKAYKMAIATTKPEESNMVYVTDTISTAIASGTDTQKATVADITAKGYYFWNGAKWVAVTTGAAKAVWRHNPTENTAELATKSDGTTARDASAQVRINDEGTVFLGANNFDDLGLPNTPIARDAYMYGSGMYTNQNWESSFRLTKYGYLDLNSFYSTSLNGEARLNLIRHRGTVIAPLAVQQNDILGAIEFKGARANAGENGFGTNINSSIDAPIQAGKLLPAKLSFYTANDDLSEAAERMTIRSSGNVGIGTASPTARLDVKGVIRFNNDSTSPVSGIVYAGGSDEGPTYEQEIVFGSSASTETQADKTSIFIGPSPAGSLSGRGRVQIGASVIQLLSPRVGIGTFAPSEKLEVTGNVKAASFISSTTTYPDYVFQKYYTGKSALKADYSFKSLSEVESFVRKNGHLPGYKSAEEVLEDGAFNLTEGHITHLEKIEELYLHTIEQEKKISAQQEEIEELKAMMKQILAERK